MPPTKLAATSRYFRPGTTKVYWVVTMATYTTPTRSELNAGVIDHMAFSAVGLTDTLATLTAHGIEHICRRQAGDGPWQVFFHDPNGARVELDFSPDEPAHSH